MPLYDYVCAACGRRFEVVHGVHGEPPTSCPLCGSGPVRKAISAPSVHFKGSGWAKKERRSAAAARSGSDSAGDDTGSTDTSSTDTGSGEASSSEAGSGAAAKAGVDGAIDDGASKRSGTTSATSGSGAKAEASGGSGTSKTAASGGD